MSNIKWYDEKVEGFLESTVYKIADIARHPPLTGSFNPLLAQLKEVYEAGMRRAMNENGVE
jgi:hypothetical protein